MARVDCWSCKNLPSSLDEEIMDKMLMSDGIKSHHLQASAPQLGPCGAQAQPESNPGIKELRGAVQRKWRKIGSNIVGAVHSLTQAMALQTRRDAQRKDERNLAWNSVIETLMRRHPGSQLPERLILLTRRHFETMPLSYVQARFSSEQVFTHIKLLDQAHMESSNLPAVAVHEVNSGQSHPSEASSGSSSPFSFESGDDEDWSTTEAFISFACNGILDKTAISCAFQRADMSVKSMQLFVTKTQSLGVAEVNCQERHLHPEHVQCIIKSATRRTCLSKTALQLSKSKSVGSSHSIKADKATGTAIKASEARGDGYTEGSRCSFASTQNETPFASTLLQFLFEEDQEIIHGDIPKTWLLDFQMLEILKPIKKCSFGTFTEYEGIYIGEKVAVKQWIEQDHLAIPALELGKELSILTNVHKNILPLRGFCADFKQSLCTVTKFMEGGSLRDLMLSNRRIELRDVVKFSKDIANGIMFLHQRGVTHGYLTAENVLLDGDGHAVVGGMGVGEPSTPRSNLSQEQGAYTLMAPEVLSADIAITAKTDVHSLGIIINSLLSCQRPVLDFYLLKSKEHAELDQCLRSLQHLVQRCCASDPVQRPNMHEVLHSLSTIQIS